MTEWSLRPVLAMLRRAARTVWLRQRQQSDVRRWQDVDNLSPSWQTRTAKLAAWVPAGSRVLEFGAGTRALPQFLPPGCVYLPSDLVDRGPGTFVCDLNGSTLPNFPPHDVAVFSGVLEYVHDLDRLVAHLAGAGAMIVASYAGADGQGSLSRRRHGWVNDLRDREFEELFARHGYVCSDRESWEAQVLYRFHRPAAERGVEESSAARSAHSHPSSSSARADAGRPRVSVVVPAFNQERYLGAAIASVLAQSFADWELIIVDDGSTDATLRVATEVADARIRVLPQDNAGVSVARNRGAAAARGEYVAFLDADDTFMPQKLAVVVDYLDQHPDVGLVYASRVETDEHGTPVNLARLPREATLATFVLTFPFAPSDCVIRREWLERVDGFRAGMVVNEDRDWYIKLALAGCQCVGLESFLASRRLQTTKKFHDLPARMREMRSALETAFSDSRCPAAVRELLGESLRNVCVNWAYQAAVQGEAALATRYFRDALHHDPSLSRLDHDGLSRALVHSATRDGGNHERRLRLVFAALPEELQLDHDARDRALTFADLLSGARACLWGREQAGVALLEKGSRSGDADEARLVADIADQWKAFASYRGAAPAERALNTLVKALHSLGMRGLARNLEACCLINVAFDQYHDAEYSRVSTTVVRAVTRRPSYLLNRGVLAIVARSAFPALRRVSG